MKSCRIIYVLALLGLLAPGVLRAAEAAKPNILFILSDDHSYPFIHCYGREEMKTPNLDRFAAEGIMFRRMFTGAPQCVPSRACFMTGRSAVACRMTRFSSPLPRDEITFPEVLRKEGGYFVGCCGRTYHLDGSGRGPAASATVFDEHHLVTFKDRFDYVDASSQEQVPAKMTEFFDQRPKDKPYFLWVGFNDPHHPWNTGKNPPDPAKLKVPGFLPDLPGVRADLSRYEGEIEHCDGDFQRVLDIVKERAGLENTLVIFMGDNGMAFPSGKGALHDPGLNVPLLAWWPGVIKPGSDSSALLSGEDLGPTCLEAAGLKPPARMSGVSFLPLLKGAAFPGERKYIFAERGPHGGATFDERTTASAMDYSRCIRSAKYKLIYNVTPSMRYTPVDSGGDPSWKDITQAHEQQQLASEFEKLWFISPRAVYELYDLEKDPNELNNLYGQPGLEDVTRELKSVMQEKMILDFDYLPLPIGADPKNKAKAGEKAQKAPNRAAQFKKLDTNHDGKLSFAEFSAGRDQAEAKVWFAARDSNHDGFLDEAEYTAGKVPNPPKR
ncbi:MAG: sulfatase-like hydrolase/transferase [Kiritimatiellaeota bacterium]|nr:sulfatase-like hydrolase/transferase [Kiritimatiellota bacterium]